MTAAAPSGGAAGPACPACGGADWDDWHAVRGLDGEPHRYGRCASCGLGHLLTAPAAELMPAWYDEGYFVDGGGRGGYRDYAADAAAHRANARARLDRVEAAAGPAGTGRRIFLDIGCATGETLDEAHDRGWETYGVEVSGWAADRARSKGHRVVPAVDLLPPEVCEVGVVGLFQVLEHLPDPAGALTEVVGRLAPGGVVVCETWDCDSAVARRFGARWQQLSAPSVLWLLSPGPGRQLVERVGLRPQSWVRTPKQVGLVTVLGQLAGRLPGSVPAALVSGLPAGLGRLRVTYRGGDLVTFVARRP